MIEEISGRDVFHLYYTMLKQMWLSGVLSLISFNNKVQDIMTDLLALHWQSTLGISGQVHFLGKGGSDVVNVA